MNFRTLIAGTAAAAMLVGAPVIAQDETFISIGTGGITGVYYPTASAICRLVNRGRKDHGIRCAVESTGGSVDNINAIKAGELEFGIVQSDWQYHAFNGSSQFSGNPFPGLRVMFSIYPEPFTLVVRADSGIDSLEDLKGKRVNVGNPGSGQRATMEVVMDAVGMTMGDFAFAAEYRGSEMANQLCENNIDAMIYTIGHPAAAIREATTNCTVKLVDVSGAAIDKLVADNRYYSVATIPGGMYDGTDADVLTFGVSAALITSESVPEDVAYTVARAVMSNLDDFRGLHPAFADLEAAKMVKDGLSAPLHTGAEKAYKELGLAE
ncbi:TAXI family TRAP transporter solute-binding subunit [Halovulum sp. GXIMD14794]